jgi:hypothetical protein
VTRALLLALAVLAALAGCASAPQTQQHPRAGSSPRVRCLSDPHETQFRPLIFLFCAESP